MGGEGSGKSEVLLNITAQCVLPCMWCGMEIGGKEVEVVWVCTDYKFDVLRLVAVLEGKVCDKLSRGNKDNTATERHFQGLLTFAGQFHSPGVASSRTVTQQWEQSMGIESNTDYQTLITFCLSRVHVIYCNSSTDLGVTLQSLRQSFLPACPNVCALVLDNVTEFYWVDRVETGSVRGSEVKQSVWVDALRVLVEEHHMVVFAARSLLFSETTTASRRDRQASEDGGGGKVCVVPVPLPALIYIKAENTSVQCVVNIPLGFSFVTARWILCFLTSTLQSVSSRSDDVMCLQWRRMVKYRFLLTSYSTHRTAQRVLPPSTISHNFIVSSQGIKFSS